MVCKVSSQPRLALGYFFSSCISRTQVEMQLDWRWEPRKIWKLNVSACLLACVCVCVCVCVRDCVTVHELRQNISFYSHCYQKRHLGVCEGPRLIIYTIKIMMMWHFWECGPNKQCFLTPGEQRLVGQDVSAALQFIFSFLSFIRKLQFLRFWILHFTKLRFQYYCD